MDELIQALQIFRKYKNPHWPTHCEHDVLYIMEVTKDEVSDEDKEKLSELGFFYSDSDDCWQSFRFGSA